MSGFSAILNPGCWRGVGLGRGFLSCHDLGFAAKKYPLRFRRLVQFPTNLNWTVTLLPNLKGLRDKQKAKPCRQGCLIVVLV